MNNFHQNSPIAVLERGLMLVQLGAIFPLVAYILRTQTVNFGLYSGWGRPVFEWHYFKFVLNAFYLGTFVIVAIRVPSIGNVIRYAGATCGLVIIFLGPIVCHWVYMQKYDGGMFKTKARVAAVAAECVVVALAVVNMIVQFLH